MAILRFGFVVLLLLCLTFSSSFGQDKDKKADDKNAKADPKEKWIPAGQVVAVLKEVRESDKSVVLSIQTRGSYYNPKQKSLVPAKMEDIELLLKDDVKIRQFNPPEAFDDKGRPKKYTIKELKELKGDDLKTPGYPADFSDLINQSIVNVTLMQKPQKPIRGGNSGLVGVAGKKEDPELAREMRPKIASIVIMGRMPENNKR
ncbi:MAG: hypothetical protein RL553_560 [Planctomycetota bacterium]|jgi:hypothetical protein